MDYNSPEYQEYLAKKRAERLERLARMEQEREAKELEPVALPEPVELQEPAPFSVYSFMPVKDSGGSSE